MTPKAPILVIFGDSIASGRHRDSEGAPTICHDDPYAYGHTIWNWMERQLPSQWHLDNGYINVANSGFGTDKVIAGGADACGDNHEPELPVILQRLRDNANSWNLVAGTAGIDDTVNWADVLTDIVWINAFDLMKTQQDCQDHVNRWQLYNGSAISFGITSNVHTISSEIEAADPLARTYWTSYYNISNTGTLNFKVPNVCDVPMANALGSLDGAIQAGLSGTQFIWVNLDPVLGSRDNRLQDLYPNDIIYKKSGWPHPNRNGAAAIGTKVVSL